MDAQALSAGEAEDRGLAAGDHAVGRAGVQDRLHAQLLIMGCDRDATYLEEPTERDPDPSLTRDGAPDPFQSTKTRSLSSSVSEYVV